MVRTCSIILSSMVGIVGRALAVDKKGDVFLFVTGNGIVFTQWSKNGFFAQHVLRYTWNLARGSGLPRANARSCQISRLSGQKCGNTAPKLSTTFLPDPNFLRLTILEPTASTESD